MSIGFSAAAKGAPEMAFWPTAVSVLYYAQVPTLLNLSVVLLMMFAGSMMYLAMRQVKSLIEGVSNKSSTRQSISRNDESLLRRGVAMDASRAAREALPSNSRVFTFVVILCAANLLGGLVLFLTLVRQILTSPNPETTVVALAVLPVLYCFVLVSILVWNN